MRFINTINATHYLYQMPNSSTNALLTLCDNGKEYVLKHAGNSQSIYGTNILIAEYLSYLIALRFNLPTPEYSFIKVTKQLLLTIEDEDIRNMLRNSPDLCIGSVFKHGALPFSDSLKIKGSANRILFKTIFGLDQYLYNADRFPQNPNLIFIPQIRQLLVIDHSLAIWPILDQEREIDAKVRTYREHVLFPFIRGNFSYAIDLIKDIYDEIIKHYIDTIPAGWLNDDMSKEFLEKFLTIRRNNIEKILLGESKCKKKNTNTSLNLF